MNIKSIEEIESSLECLVRHKKMEFGIIFHWGLYSVPAYDSIKSARRRKLQNGSEWYLKRLTENGTYRPVSGHLETKDYHNKTWNNIDYYDFITHFNKDTKNWDPDKWMLYCKSIGAKYVILTSKHHDGFCLWNTKSTERKSTNNLLEKFGISAKKFGLKFGIYYSWGEFDISITKKYLETIQIQINELLKFEPDLFWFDDNWDIKTQTATKTINSICEKIRKLGIEINNRIPKNNENFDFKSFEKHFPVEKDKKWEYIDTVGYSWGRNKDQSLEDYKTSDDIKKLLEKAKKLGCSKFTLNLGPDSKGDFDPFEEKILSEIN